MTTAMRASFTLTLEDKLSSGLQHIQKLFSELRTDGDRLGLGRLERGGELLRGVVQEVQTLTSSLRSIETTADRGWAALKRMGSAAFGPESRLGQFGSKVGALGAAAAGYSIYAPMQAYGEYENTLRHVGITEKLSGPAVETEIARLNANLRAEALASGQNSAELSKAYTFLITTGMSPALVDSLMPSHAKAATAYNISSESMGQAVFALNDSFKIGHTEMGAALSAMAYAAKEAHFTVENFSQFLPSIGGRMQLLGMTGRAAADTAFAALETVVKNSSMPSQAATNFQDLMQYMTAPIATHSFAKQGINLPKMLIDAEKQGVSPLDAFLGKLDQLTRGKSPVEAAEIIGKLVHNQEAASAALSLLQHKNEYLRMRDMLGKVDASTLETDFQTAFRAPLVQMRLMEEMTQQLQRRFGEGFEPVLHLVNGGLMLLLKLVDGLDKKFPGVGTGALTVVGGMLALTTALGAIGFVGPMIVAGFELMAAAVAALLSPLGLLALAIAAIAVAVYDWDAVQPYVQEAGDAIGAFSIRGLNAVRDFVVNGWNYMSDAISGNQTIQTALTDLGHAWDALKDAAGAAFRVLDGWSGGALQSALDAIAAALQKIIDGFQWLGEHAPATGGASGGADNQASPGTDSIFPNYGAPAQHQLDVTVHAAPGTHAAVTHASPGVTVNPGQTTNRP